MPAAPTWAQRHRPVWRRRTGPDRRGGQQPAGHRTAGHRTGGHQPAGRWTGGHLRAGHRTGGHLRAGHRTGGHLRAGHRTGGQQMTGPPDTRTTNPGGRPPDGLDTGRLDRRIPDDDPGWVNTRCWTPTDAMAGVFAVSTRAMTPHRWMAAGRSAGQTPAGRATTQDRSAARTPRAPRCYRPAWLPPRPSAAGGRPPSSRRLGALLSSDDFGSSVERQAAGQVLWRGHMRAGAVVFSVWCWIRIGCRRGRAYGVYQDERSCRASTGRCACPVDGHAL
jgi:hypothetical protein